MSCGAGSSPAPGPPPGEPRGGGRDLGERLPGRPGRAAGGGAADGAGRATGDRWSVPACRDVRGVAALPVPARFPRRLSTRGVGRPSRRGLELVFPRSPVRFGQKRLPNSTGGAGSASGGAGKVQAAAGCPPRRGGRGGAGLPGLPERGRGCATSPGRPREAPIAPARGLTQRRCHRRVHGGGRSQLRPRIHGGFGDCLLSLKDGRTGSSFWVEVPASSRNKLLGRCWRGWKVLLRRCFLGWTAGGKPQADSTGSSVLWALYDSARFLQLQEMDKKSLPSSSPPTWDLSLINWCGCYHAYPPLGRLVEHVSGCRLPGAPLATCGLGCVNLPWALPAEPAGEVQAGVACSWSRLSCKLQPACTPGAP